MKIVSFGLDISTFCQITHSIFLDNEQMFFVVLNAFFIMIDSRTFENLILTNTIVAAFCIVLLITLIGFILVLLVPSIRNRWFGINERHDKSINDLSSLSRQTSFHNLPSGSSRYNPIFEASPTTTTTQFGTLFHPQATTATLLHPTIWTSMTPTPILSSPPPPHPSSSTQTTSTPPTPKRSPVRLPRAPNMTSPTATVPQRSPKKR